MGETISVKAHVKRPTPESLEWLLKALADRTRLRLLSLLSAGEFCVCHLQESLDLPQPTVSRHLAYLRKVGLVTTRRDGLWVHYRRQMPRDRVLRSLVESVTHSTTHMSTYRRDRQRLERAIGCCVEPATTVGEPSCCGPS